MTHRSEPTAILCILSGVFPLLPGSYLIGISHFPDPIVIVVVQDPSYGAFGYMLYGFEQEGKKAALDLHPPPVFP